jgi:hypothetical protein
LSRQTKGALRVAAFAMRRAGGSRS